MNGRRGRRYGFFFHFVVVFWVLRSVGGCKAGLVVANQWPASFVETPLQHQFPTAYLCKSEFGFLILCSFHCLSPPGPQFLNPKSPPRVSAGRLPKSFIIGHSPTWATRGCTQIINTNYSVFPKTGKVSKTKGSLKFPKLGPPNPHVDKQKAPFLSE